MAKKTWTFTVGDATHNATLERKGISIDGGETILFKNMTKTGNSLLEMGYSVDVDGANVMLIRPSMGQPDLVVDGISATTGASRELLKFQPWCWIFIVLYGIDFIVLCGGAIGAVINLLAFASSVKLGSDPSKATGKKILLCGLLYIGITIVELIIGVGTALLLRSM